MGHTEMLLAVAGLEEKGIAEKTRQLAESKWSSLSTEEQVAFSFAIKLCRQPDQINETDRQSLIRQFGPDRALDVIWWSCRCHYMTRVADAFQLPLERENVFGK
jgi:hypothetical protein